MKIDLNKCRFGDILISKHGMEFRYLGRMDEADYYDHFVLYPDKSLGSRCNDGFVFKNESGRLDSDHDIVKIIHLSWTEFTKYLRDNGDFKIMIEINGKTMSKAWHYDACIQDWNWMAENFELYKLGGKHYLKGKAPNSKIHNPYADCFSCEYSNGECHTCPFIKKYEDGCFSNGNPYKNLDNGSGKKQDCIEIAQLFIDHHPNSYKAHKHKMEFKNAGGKFCSKEEWDKLPAKKRFVQFLKFYDLYYLYRFNIKNSNWWKDGKPLYMETKYQYISSAFEWSETIQGFIFWKKYSFLWVSMNIK